MIKVIVISKSKTNTNGEDTHIIIKRDSRAKRNTSLDF